MNLQRNEQKLERGSILPCTDIRFLIVEDHEFQRGALAQLLTTLGATEVHLAEDGRSALRILRDPGRPVDIVISDLSMPGMDGMEFIRHLSDAGTRVSLILASGLDQDVIVSIAHMAVAYKVHLLGAIGKPPTAAKLVPLIELFRAGNPTAATGDARFGFEEIADAWAHDDFEAWLEPRAGLTTGAIRSVEVSARWRHSTAGVLLPEAFMPSVRARGLKDDFMWLLIQKAVTQCHRLNVQGLEIGVCVNLGFTDLADSNIAAQIQHIVDAAGVDPRWVTFSVTEADLNTGSPHTLENLARLRVLGFGLAIDDFGSGSMAVEQLSLVAFTELKIKSSFVADTDGSSRAGLAAGLEIGQRLKLRTVGSGVSTKEDWTLLREWGCDAGQGPFISPPISPEALPAWLARRNAARIGGGK